ncbi:MAG TPA: Na+/H+ antiporter [Chiayiivirga sp.]|nr:Na+/H+ antiporter [Chiayiivirga sp.]
MSTIMTILAFLLAVAISGPLARALRVPLPLIQIALGYAIAEYTGESVALDPEVFFLLFLPPLLFLDGWRIPKDGLYRDKGTVIGLALGLVVFTVLGVGTILHWMIPAMPWAVAFALAAILSPTDPIAVSAIASRTPIPPRLMHLLEGESLLNDASGLVCMRFAVAAALTGSFSLEQAALNFVWVALAGLAVGVVLTWGVTRVRDLLLRRLGEDPGSSILTSLLIPFAAYLLAEAIEASGILAAVAAGISMSLMESTRLLASTRVQRRAFWDTVQFAANGVIFVLLGEQIPALFAGAVDAVDEAGRASPWWLALYVAGVVAALAALRYLWVGAALRLSEKIARRRGQPHPEISRRVVVAMSLAGVRGAVTLAGILTLPMTLHDGHPFPARDLAIFLAAGVILASLILASAALPRLLRDMPSEGKHASEAPARRAAAAAGLRAIEDHRLSLAQYTDDPARYAAIAARLAEDYRHRIEPLDAAEGGGPVATQSESEEIEHELRLAGVAAERRALLELRRQHRIDETTFHKLLRELDLAELRWRI